MNLAPSLAPSRTTGQLVDAFGGRYYRIAHVDELPTFFMNVVSSSDLWLFLASNGGLTAGRVDAEHALFPYHTVDKIYDSPASTGPFTALWVSRGSAPATLWEPFASHTARRHAITRNLYKSLEGDRVWFEEINPALGLVFRSGWCAADDHGLLRQCALVNLGDSPVSIRLLDGLRNFLPPGIPLALQNTSSCLADAYKTAEHLPGSSLAVYSLAAAIVDRAIPMESLRAAIVWSEGLPDARILLSDTAIDRFAAGADLPADAHRRGVRLAYGLTTTLTLAAGADRRWIVVADTHLTQAEVAARHAALARGPVGPAVLAAADASTQRLRRFVAAADGLQTGAAETTTAHHFANVLFNVMRGGIFAAGYDLPSADFAAFVRTRHRPAAARHAALLVSLPPTLPRADLLARLAATGDADLERLGFEYLPLTFSRRHGDPSRPWNRFSIRVRDEHGQRLLAHEGNWRDIFQNWEALCLSFPDYFESIVAKFVNASTPDGYNPYRLGHTGLDWEVPEPENPWSSIGYWGDHQTVYLLKLLEWSGRFHPGLLRTWLRRERFSYANVPYRIADYTAQRRDPHNTIAFDAQLHRTIEHRLPEFGSDARLVLRADGSVHHVNLAEKLLLLVLTRLTNFVPGGGIWMNTQRPEWNDANNALVGYGVSLVTLCYLRRLLHHLATELVPALGEAPVAVSAPLATLVHDVLAALEAHRPLLATPSLAPANRRTLLDALGSAGSAYRSTVYRDGLGAPVALPPATLAALLATALAFVDHTLRSNRRADGLYHAYNLLEFTEEPAGLVLHPLAPMLEGQVAILSSGLLSPAEAVNLLVALRASPLYRPDQHSYLLYPDRQLPAFLARNVLPPDAVAACPLLRELLAAGHDRLVVRDVAGTARFHPDLVNGAALDQRLAALAAEPAWSAAVAAHAPQVRAIYERVFHHRAFTGRSGSMFGYEGLGCIYWHMVAKLLLAVQENLQHALAAGDPAAARLAAHYYDVRAGLGFNKSPAVYGAFPTDPYSHTPGHAGAQQPGMTGQVKEEILTRAGEFGVTVAAGALTFAPALLLAGEFAPQPSGFLHFDDRGEEHLLPLPADALAFTVCGVPVVYRRSAGPAQLTVYPGSGDARVLPGRTLDAATSAALFARDGTVARLEVALGDDFRPFVPQPPL